MSANDIYEAVVDATYAGQNIATVLHFTQVGGDGSGDPRDSIGLMFTTVFETAMVDGLNDNLSLVALRTRRIFPSETQATTLVLTGVGNVVPQGLPPNQVAVIRTYGNLTGRRGIGRILVSGIPEEDVIKGRLNSDQITLRNVFADLLEADQDDGVTAWLWRACVYSRLDDIGRKIENAGLLTIIRNLRSRTRSA